MMRKPVLLIALVAVVAALFGLKLQRGTWADPAPPLTQALGGEHRYLTSISSDKPLYKPGESAYFRGVLLHAFKHQPLEQNEQAFGFVEVKGPKGDTLASGHIHPSDSTWAFAWPIPENTPGGEYTLRAMYPGSGHAPAERKFDVRAYRAPRLKSQIVFLRDGYGPGEKVSATLHTERAEGGIPEGAIVRVLPNVDGVQLQAEAAKIDGAGNCTVSFDLPKNIERGEGTLALAIQDGGVVESATKTIPILLQTFDLTMYPEGGDLIAGWPNRVYVQARQTNGKPADIEFRVIPENDPAAWTEGRTEHEGRGRFEFWPKADTKYVLRVVKPSGIARTFPLPEVKKQGVVLRVPDETIAADQDVRIALLQRDIGKARLVLSCREMELDAVNVDFATDAQKKDPPYAWKTLKPKDASGVLRVTVYDEKNTPLAERLVYRHPKEALRISITPDQRAYVPGGKVTLNVKTTNSKGEPAGAVVGLTVTDDSVLEMIERREQAPRLPVMALLEPEVEDLADAHVYLDSSNPKAALATDLLLGTQGWRRFSFMKHEEFIAQHGDKARRAVALRFMAESERRRRLPVMAEFGGGCFLAGTQVLTPDGSRAIESVKAGDAVLSYDSRTQKWLTTSVKSPLRHAFSGDVITLQAKGETIEATGNHPFWVVAGEGLAARPRVEDLSERERLLTADGRWVEARALRSGDTLLTQSGEVKIQAVNSRSETTPVYNLALPEPHTYAVSAAGIVVHNKEADIADPFEMQIGADRGAIKEEGMAKNAAAPPPGPAALAAAPADRPVRVIEAHERQKTANASADRLNNAIKLADASEKKRKIMADERAQMSGIVAVREFAHAVRPDRKPNDRVDFTETLYWNAALKTDEKTGEASVTFALNDSVTTFRASADAFNASGALGATSAVIESVQPFYIEPKLPLEITAGDTILLPLGVVNAIDSDLGAATIRATLPGNFKLSEIAPFELKGMARVRQILQIKAGDAKSGQLELSAQAGPYSDKVTRKLSVKPYGFPIETPFGGMLGANSGVTHTVVVPATVVPASLQTNIAVYPTPLANMTEALQSLIQNPSGCFEQTSSTSYPLTMVQQYFLSHTGVDPKLIAASKEKLDAGYKRLVSFWCPDRGYEWFGADPGHEALTAFGLLHFQDMSKVMQVDRAMIDTTSAWLMKQRNGKGGFERKRRALHTWIEDVDCSNGYITWALLENGQQGLEKEIEAVKTAGAQSNNSYAVALAANVASLSGDKTAAESLMKKLAAKQNKTGGVDGATASIVGSGGEALEIEATALATLAWLRDPQLAGNVERSMKYLADSCKGGRYGSTQSTVLALRAIVEYDKQRAHPKAPGKVRIFVDGQGVGEWMAFDEKTQGAIKLPDVSELLTPGEHKLELKMENGSSMPYALSVSFNASTPAISKACKLEIATKLAQTELAEGAATEASVIITNEAKEVIPNPVAIVGLPGGLEVRHDQLKELVKKGTIDAYEVIGREVVLYWRSLASEAVVNVPISAVAAVPGTYTGPASRTYLYYTDEHKHWVDGLKVNITPR